MTLFLYLAPEELDPLEMLEAANIIDRLPTDFFEKIVSFQFNRLFVNSIFGFRNQNNGKIEKKYSMN
jgi:hypothetical protein